MSRNGTTRPADALIPAANVDDAPAAIARPLTHASTPSIVSSTTYASLCAPPTTCTSVSGFRPTNSVGARGSRPSRSAVRQTTAASASEASAAAALRSQNAVGTPSPASGYVESVNSGPYAEVAVFDPA